MSEFWGPLFAVQRRPRYRLTATLVATVAGLGLGSVHWLGLVAGGALVGLCWPTLGRAVLAGLGFGVVVICAFALRLWLAGALGPVLGASRVLALAAISPLVAGAFGALARGLLPETPPA